MLKQKQIKRKRTHWAKSFEAPLYIVHMADKEGLETLNRCKRGKYPVYIETCPQYLEYTCDVYRREDGRNFVCSPPIKKF